MQTQSSDADGEAHQIKAKQDDSTERPTPKLTQNASEWQDTAQPESDDARATDSGRVADNSIAQSDEEEKDDFHDAPSQQVTAKDPPSAAESTTTPAPSKKDLPPIDTDTRAKPTSDDDAEAPTSAKRSPQSPTSAVTRDLAEQLAQSPTLTHNSRKSVTVPFSEWSHQQLAPQVEDQPKKEEDEGEWQEMPALATHRVYDDWGKVLAKSYDEIDDESFGYGALGGAGKGYTKVHVDDDVASQTSFDDNTAYLFKEGYARNALDEEDEARDIISQMQTTKELLTEGQRIAYVGVVRLSLIQMMEKQDSIERTKGAKKAIDLASESMRLWSQKMMVRVYSHMDISSQEQIMVEQLAEHGVLPEDLTPVLMQNARVKNPKQGGKDKESGETEDAKQDEEGEDSKQDEETKDSTKDGDDASSRLAEDDTTPKHKVEGKDSQEKEEDKTLAQDGITETSKQTDSTDTTEPPTPVSTPLPSSDHSASSQSGPSKEEKAVSLASSPSETSLPTYEQTKADGLHIERPEDLPDTQDLDLDIRWTVLCDLFLLLIADGNYDSRSRTLLERVGGALAIDWQEICRFEKRVTDALEMQEQAGKETWNEDEHMEARRKAAQKRRMVVMGLCTVGGGLVIGLSAGLMAPVIGAGLAAGFTSIGVAGTSSFLAGAGAATLIGTTGAGIGARIGINASNRRTGAVKTFEYRPLHNNKRVNLIVTVSGWMTGAVDDVRLPFSTVDPVMGDIYSIHWEPEMLQSTGQTVQILATEALTQTIQQILTATALSTLMAGLAAPIVLTKLAYLIDNPWTVSLARADAAGLILADSLVDRNLGARPITLVGFSLGARLIFSCLRELARRGAVGLVQNVYLFGAPVVIKKDEWLRSRTVVPGRFVNAYAGHDWILRYLFRATSGGLRSIAGLSAVQVAGVENVDISETVPGHMAYRGLMPILLTEVGFEVDSEEFTEIEDPDPDNHEKRQRQLISDIEEARRQLEEKPEKKGFLSRFTRRKAAKKDWETYDENAAARIDESKDPETIVKENADVLFDVEAIRREALELAKQGAPVDEITSHISIREIESTMPPMRISTGGAGSPAASDAVQTPPATGSSNVGADHQLSPESKGATPRKTKSHDEPVRAHSFANGILSHASPSIRASSMDTPAAVGNAETQAKGTAADASKRLSASRPSLQSHSSAPVGSTSEGVAVPKDDTTHRAWEEDEDADFGREKEIEMSFE